MFVLSNCVTTGETGLLIWQRVHFTHLTHSTTNHLPLFTLPHRFHHLHHLRESQRPLIHFIIRPVATKRPKSRDLHRHLLASTLLR